VIAKSYDGVRNAIIKEQFINACPKELSVFLKERPTIDLQDIAMAAEQYLNAHQSQLSTLSNNNRVPTKSEDKASSQENREIRCYNCNGRYHKASECRKPKTVNSQNQYRIRKTCSNCNNYGHEAKDCWKKTKVAVSVGKEHEDLQNEDVKEVSSGLLVQNTTERRERILENIENDALKLANGDSVSIITNVCNTTQKKGEMPVVHGLVNEQEVKCLRDTGCNGIVIKEKFVLEEQYTGNYGYMLLVDNTVRKARKAIITVDSPYLQGNFEALCLPDVIYDLIIGNIPEALPPDEPLENWKPSKIENDEANLNSNTETTNETATTKIDESRPKIDIYNIDTEKLKSLQKEDTAVQRCLQKKENNKRKYIMRNGIVCEVSTDKCKEIDPKIVIPTKLRVKIMSIGHEIPMAGHLGTKKTLNRIRQNFVWPGMTKDIREFCKTCDICQKTTPKGKEASVPLGTVPLVDNIFQRVAFDLIGPLPKTNEGHKYVLTLVDYATRYPEAIPLKDISAESVAKAMMSVYSRMGIPTEILTDQGRQFTAKYLNEVNDLLRIHHLTTTPYHPQCNGLVESFNKTLTTMIRRTCHDNPKRWNEYLDPLLFAYREVPQTTTGFSPFELLYGRTVRGPLSVLKEIWNDEGTTEEKTYYQHFMELREKLQETLMTARDEIDKAHTKQKSYYDKNTKKKDIKAGDEVLILLPTDTNKIQMKWRGPYRVIDEPHCNDFILKVKGKMKTYHANMLKKYNRRDKVTEEETSKDSIQSCSIAIIEEHEEIDEKENKDLYLLEIETKETFKDVKINGNLSEEEREKSSK